MKMELMGPCHVSNAERTYNHFYKWKFCVKLVIPSEIFKCVQL